MLTNKRSLLDMFLDRTANETHNVNRFVTTETSGGSVALVAYGWLKLAEYDERRNAVTVFTGHQSLRSTTVSRWLNDVISRANERGRDVILSGESPVVDSPNEGAKYISNYVSMDGKQSKVELDCINEVEGDLKDLDPSAIEA